MKKEVLIVVINITVILLVLLLVMAAQSFPYFTASILGIVTGVFLYMLTEQWMTHDAVEFENRFWTLMAFALARTCLICRDSPMRISSDQPTVAWTLVVIFTFLAHNYDRHLRRIVLRRVPNIRRKIKSAVFDSEIRMNADVKIAELRELLQSIDQRWMSSTFLNFFFLPRVLYVESAICKIFTEADSDELNIIIPNIELALIFYKIKDHKIARRANRTRLLNVLSVDRISDLNVPAKAMLLDALMRLKLSAHPNAEAYVKNIILKTKSDDLSELKSLTDAKGDINSMHHLVYGSIRGAAIKETILKYIAQQANIQAAHTSLGSKAGKRRGKFAWRKILSDVDDTLSCSGGSWPAGIDTAYPKKAIYPGVIAFYRELDLGVTGAVDEWDNSRVGNLVFLSARPHVYKDMSENVTYGKLEMLQEERGLHTSPTLLAGSLETGKDFMVRGDCEPLAIKKYENFSEYLTLYPEFTCIFIGDNGQGDVRCAEMATEEGSPFRNNMQRVYIHVVQPLESTHCNVPPSRRAQKRIAAAANSTAASPAHSKFSYKDVVDDTSSGLNSCTCYFGTYVEAAVDAYYNKLIRGSGLRRIMEEAVKDFCFIPLDAWQSAGPLSKTQKGKVGVGKDSGATRARSNSTTSFASPSTSLSNTSFTYGAPCSNNIIIATVVGGAVGGAAPPSTPASIPRQIGVPGAVPWSPSGAERKSIGGVGVGVAVGGGVGVVVGGGGGGSGPMVTPIVSTPLFAGGEIGTGKDGSEGRRGSGSGMPSKSDSVTCSPERDRPAPIETSTSTAKPYRFPLFGGASSSSSSGGTSASSSSSSGSILANSSSNINNISITSSSSTGGSNKNTNSKIPKEKHWEKPEVKRELRAREINRDLEQGNSVLKKAGLAPVEPIKFACKAPVGTTVNTVFGRGLVVGFRESDGIYEIEVPVVNHLHTCTYTPTHGGAKAKVSWKGKEKEDDNGSKAKSDASLNNGFGHDISMVSEDSLLAPTNPKSHAIYLYLPGLSISVS